MLKLCLISATIDKVNSICLNGHADLSLDSLIRHMDRTQEALKMGALGLNTHKSFYPNSVYLTVKQSVFFWGFFTSAVLRRNNSAKVGVTDRVKHSQRAAGGRDVSQPRHIGRDRHRVSSAVNGLSSRAEGSTVNRPYRAKSENARTGNVTGMLAGETLNPQH
jgi:hypothetical protein